MLWHQVRMPKPIAKFRDDVPEGLTKIIDRMMAKEPDRRFQAPADLADILAEFTTTRFRRRPRRKCRR